MGHMGGTKDKRDGTTEIDRPWTDRKHLKHQIFSQKGRTMSGEVQTSCRTTLITLTLEEWQTDLNPLLTCSTLCGWVSFDVGRCTDYFLIRQNNVVRQVLLYHLPESLMNMIILFTVPEHQSGGVEYLLFSSECIVLIRFLNILPLNAQKAKMQNTTQRYPEGVVNNQNHILLIGPGRCRKEERNSKDRDMTYDQSDWRKDTVQTDRHFDICRQVVTCYWWSGLIAQSAHSSILQLKTQVSHWVKVEFWFGWQRFMFGSYSHLRHSADIQQRETRCSFRMLSEHFQKNSETKQHL